ncbi:hypothetical protein BSSX_p20022 (plasmid) [Bacillus subtilis]|nr:hypothetical protein BSSX_p20001 [Bacillus subtilis]ASK26327.1 hypothetical protein BSSX_p20011 [Bacillus subtilis]ASK26338.1 hypothetical protein BSSX_p20022 [Bacillus subtilis]
MKNETKGLFFMSKDAFVAETEKAKFQKKSPPYGGKNGFDLLFWVLKKPAVFSRSFSILAKPKSGLFLS